MTLSQGAELSETRCPLQMELGQTDTATLHTRTATEIRGSEAGIPKWRLLFAVVLRHILVDKENYLCGETVAG